MGKGLPYSRSRGLETAPIARKDVRIDHTVSMTNGTPGYGSVVIGGLPEGNIKLIGAVLSNLTFTHSGGGNIADTFDGDFALGTGADEDGSLTGDEVDLIPSTATNTASGGSSTGNRGVSTSTEEVIIDNTDGADALNLNVLIDGADISGAEDVTVEGALHLVYAVLGDD